MPRLTVNGKSHDIDVDPNTPLLWVLREQVALPAPNMVAVLRNAERAPCMLTVLLSAPAPCL